MTAVDTPITPRSTYRDRTPVVGDVITHPVHGPVRVVATTIRQVRGTAKEYVDLEVVEGAMRISVPMERAEDVGLRDLLEEDQICDILEMLAGPETDRQDKDSWAHRMKELHMQLQSGSLTERVCVVRQILRESGEIPSSLALRDLLRSAISPLASEISIARGISPEAARELLIDAALPGRPHAA